MLARPMSSRENLQRESLFRGCLQRGLESQNRQEWPQAVAAAREALNCEGYSKAPEAFDLLNRTNQYGKRLQMRNGFYRVVLSGCAGRFALSPDGRCLLWPSEDNSLHLSELSSGRCVRTFEGHTKVVMAVAFSDDGCWALSGSNDNTFRLWEVASGHCVRVFEGKAEKVLSVAPSTDGRWLVLSEDRDSHYLHLWEAASGRCARTFKGHRKDVWSAALSADERLVLSCGDDNDRTIRLWEVASGRCVRTFAGPPLRQPVHSAVFSADGIWALSGSGGSGKDNTVRLWEVAAGGRVRTFEGHTDSVRSVAFSGDGRWLLSGSNDRTLRLWDVATGRCVRIFEGHTNAVIHVALSSDGRWALSRSSDGTLRLWELDWECEFPDVAAWDEGARPYLGLFLTLHCPVGNDGLTRSGRPVWTGEEFQTLLADLRCCGYGWLRPEGVRQQLEKMTAEWEGPPLMVWEVAK
jgi:WD40 repeat protein